MIKIRVEHNNKEAGLRSYYLMTSDAASLEARVCAADTACNDSGIDPALYDVYKEGSDLGEDMHSMTGFNTFCKSINMMVNEYTCEDGKVFLLVDSEEAYNENKNLIPGDNFTEGDSICCYKDVTDEEKQSSTPHKIVKKVRRELTIHDFLKRKKTAPFSNWRQTAKLLNFLLLFGGGASVLRKQLQASKFSVDDCLEYLKLVNGMSVFNDLVIKAGKGYFKEYEMRSDVECRYLACATLMREAFLKGYAGLVERINREIAFARIHFYLRNYYGAIRWAPEFAYMNIDPITGGLKGVDKKYFSGQYKHVLNNCANTNIQTGETVFIYAAWINTTAYLKEWLFRSRFFNSIHDSLDSYVYKPEKEVLKATINETMAGTIRYPFNGIHHRMDSEVSDIRDREHLKNHYYKHGEEEKSQKIDVAIDAFNKKYEKFGVKPIKYHGTFC